MKQCTSTHEHIHEGHVGTALPMTAPDLHEDTCTTAEHNAVTLAQSNTKLLPHTSESRFSDILQQCVAQSRSVQSQRVVSTRRRVRTETCNVEASRHGLDLRGEIYKVLEKRPTPLGCTTSQPTVVTYSVLLSVSSSLSTQGPTTVLLTWSRGRSPRAIVPLTRAP